MIYNDALCSIPVRVTKTSCSQGSRMFFFVSMRFGPSYGNRTARARRPAYRRAKRLLRSLFRAREIPHTGHRQLLLQLRLEEIFLFPYEELLRRRPPPAADAGSRSRAAGRRRQAPPKGRRLMRGTRARYRAAREIPVGSANKTNPNLMPVGDGFGFIVYKE